LTSLVRREAIVGCGLAAQRMASSVAMLTHPQFLQFGKKKKEERQEIN
jgi:hypothetical protein